MNWIKKHKGILITSVVVLAVLVFAFWYGGGSPGMHGWAVQDQTETVPQSQEPLEEPEPADEPEAVPQSAPEEKEEAVLQQTVEQLPEQPPETELAVQPVEEQIQILNEDEQIPKEDVLLPEADETEPQTSDEVEGKREEYTCTISISCLTVLDHRDWLVEGKTDVVPTDGWILLPTVVTFSEGESVFDVLQRICMDLKIHMEFEYTPVYQSAYIEGIGNLYEFDCGELSGWMYKVNDWFPNYGCSQYVVKDQDEICWVYTCDLGNDVGGGF